METKCLKEKKLGIANFLGFQNLGTVEVVGLAGGIAFLWMEECCLTISKVIVMMEGINLNGEGN